MIVFGNRDTLRHEPECWGPWIDWAEEHGLVYGQSKGCVRASSQNSRSSQSSDRTSAFPPSRHHNALCPLCRVACLTPCSVCPLNPVLSILRRIHDDYAQQAADATNAARMFGGNVNAAEEYVVSAEIHDDWEDAADGKVCSSPRTARPAATASAAAAVAPEQHSSRALHGA